MVGIGVFLEVVKLPFLTPTLSKQGDDRIPRTAHLGKSGKLNSRGISSVGTWKNQKIARHTFVELHPIAMCSIWSKSKRVKMHLISDDTELSGGLIPKKERSDIF